MNLFIIELKYSVAFKMQNVNSIFHLTASANNSILFKWMQNKVPAYCFVYFHFVNAMIVRQIFVLGFEYFDKIIC